MNQHEGNANPEAPPVEPGAAGSPGGWVRRLVSTFIAISGLVPEHATWARALVMASSVGFSWYLGTFQPANQRLALLYALGGILTYVGFIGAVLTEHGLRRWFVKRWGEQGGYLTFEAILGFLFFHNAAAIGYVSTSSPGGLVGSVPREGVVVLAGILFVVGSVTKLWAAMVVSIDIYYWKDMFLGRKVSEFVVTGPYRYLKNPMYGVGQLQAYAFALWYDSPYGMALAFINQCCVLMFYWAVEKPFIHRTYTPRPPSDAPDPDPGPPSSPRLP